MKIVLISAAVFILDQVTKWLTEVKLSLGESVPVFGDALQLTHIQNQGMAFGIAIPNKILFNAVSIIAAGAILYYVVKFRNEKFLPRFALTIIFGGAVGNLSDRLIYGRVVDFIDVNIPDLYIPSYDLYIVNTPVISLMRWPIFNVADMAVSLGMFLLVFAILVTKNPWYYPQSSEAEGGIPLEDPEQQS